MTASLLSVGLFCAAFVIHVLVWKSHLLKRSYVNLILIFLIVYLLGAVGFLSANLLTLFQGMYLTLVSLSLFAAYLLTYPGIEADSPSNEILLIVERAAEQGLSLEEYFDILNDGPIILDRIQGLLDNRKITIKNGKYQLTGEGEKFLRFFVSLRRIYTKRPFGG